MSIQLLRTAKLTADIRLVEIIRLKTGPDQIHLVSNWIDPCGFGPLAFSFPVPRGTGLLWAEQNFPSVEIHAYVYDMGRLTKFWDRRSAQSAPPATPTETPALSVVAG